MSLESLGHSKKANRSEHIETPIDSELEDDIQRIVLDVQRNTVRCDEPTIDRLAATTEGQRALLNVFEASRRIQAQLSRYLGVGSLGAFAYSGLAASVGDSAQMSAASGIGAAGLAVTLAALVFEQIDLSERIKRRIPTVTGSE